MALRKREYTDNETVITAENMNDIQDAVIALEDGLFSVDNDKIGEIITITDASKRGFRSFNIYGKTTQYGTPTPDAPIDIVSLGDDGSVCVTINGVNLFNLNSGIISGTSRAVTFIDNGFVLDASSPDTRICRFKCSLKKGNTYFLSYDAKVLSGEGEVKPFIPKIEQYLVANKPFIPEADADEIGIYVNGASVPTVAEVTNIQVSLGNEKKGYAPFMEQSATIATPNGLRGIPVSSGGNYTDADGQQWICDEIDFVRGVYVQRVGQKVFDGSRDETWNVYEYPSYEGYYHLIEDMAVGRQQSGYCDKIPVHTHSEQSLAIWLGVNSNIMFVHNALDLAANLDSWKAWLSENPITVQYIMATPIETTLSEEELAAYAALHTYKDHTTVSNDAGAWMDLEYVMDAKKYIDGLVAGTIIPATVE